MENYQTPEDSNPLEIIIEPSSDAAFDGPNEVMVTVYHDDNPRKWRKIAVTEISNGIYKAEIEKDKLTDRPIVKIRSSFIVDSNQMPNKSLVVQQTTVDYNFDGGNGSADYKSTHDQDPTEYDEGRSNDETFTVTKRVSITLT